MRKSKKDGARWLSCAYLGQATMMCSMGPMSALTRAEKRQLEQQLLASVDQLQKICNALLEPSQARARENPHHSNGASGHHQRLGKTHRHHLFCNSR